MKITRRLHWEVGRLRTNTPIHLCSIISLSTPECHPLIRSPAETEIGNESRRRKIDNFQTEIKDRGQMTAQRDIQRKSWSVSIFAEISTSVYNSAQRSITQATFTMAETRFMWMKSMVHNARPSSWWIRFQQTNMDPQWRRNMNTTRLLTAAAGTERKRTRPCK